MEPVPVYMPPADAGAPEPVVELPPDAIVQVALGNDMGCLRRHNGSVDCWGAPFGSLTTIDGIEAASLAVGPYLACATSPSGSIACWSDASGARPLTGAAGDILQVGVGGGPCVASSNDTVYCWNADLTSPVAVEVPDLAGLAVGDMHVCALQRDGGVMCWGSNSQGQLGVAGGGGATPRRVDIPAAVAVDAKGRQSCALTADGVAYCWGAPSTSPAVPEPYRVAGVPTIDLLAVGSRFICVRDVDRGVWCWGKNDDGALGDGSLSPEGGPLRARIDDVDALDAGAGHACAVTGGQVYCWGDNDRGQLLRPDGTAAPVAVAGVTDAVELATAAHTTCAIHSDRTVSCWGRALASYDAFMTPQTIANLTDVDHLYLSSIHACALRRDKTVACFGHNGEGQLGNGTTDPASGAVAVKGLAGVKQLAVGADFACAIVAKGKVECWGSVSNGMLGKRVEDGEVATTPSPVAGLRGVTKVVAGWHDACAILAGGKVKCWGAHRDHGTQCKIAPNDQFRCTKPPSPAPALVAGVSNIEHIEIYDSQSGSLYSKDGKEYTLWLYAKGVPGSETGTWGGSEFSRYEVGARAELVGEAGDWRPSGFCRAEGDGTATCGYNQNVHGEAGQGHFEPVEKPAVVPGLDGVVQVVSGSKHACALLEGGTVQCWGNNAYGQLGPTDAGNRGVPAPIAP